MIENKLSVRLYSQPIGILERTSQGKMHFSYHHDNRLLLSNSMPLKERAFEHKHCRAYFGGLLPELESTKMLLAKKYGFDTKDIFSFLAHFGKDCSGAVSFHRVSDPIDSNYEIPLETRILSEKEMSKAIAHVTQEPLLFDLFENYPLLSGDSTKVGICLVNDKIAIPIKKGVSTHILKVNEDEDSLLNQYFCLKVARYAGLTVPDFALKSIAKQFTLILKRFDRTIEEHRVKKIHQEDLCQALGLSPVRKFERDKGPSCSDLFGLLNRMSIPARERHRMIKTLMFNYFINNTGAHGKNISFISKQPTLWEMAPFYDLLCTIEEKTPFAMSMGNKTIQSEVTDHDWQNVCEQIGYTTPIFKSILNEYAHTILEATHQAFNDFKKEGLGVSVADKIRRSVKDVVEGRSDRP